jgi:hypothetical protein
VAALALEDDNCLKVINVVLKNSGSPEMSGVKEVKFRLRFHNTGFSDRLPWESRSILRIPLSFREARVKRGATGSLGVY